MPNNAVDGRMICPFYKRDTLQEIRCDGFARGMSLRQWFTRKRKKAAWLEEACCRYDYRDNCPLARALYQHNEGGGNSACMQMKSPCDFCYELHIGFFVKVLYNRVRKRITDSLRASLLHTDSKSETLAGLRHWSSQGSEPDYD